MRIKLPNERAYDRAGTGDHSLFSSEHCCVCGRRLLNLEGVRAGQSSAAGWLLLTRAVDGTCEYAISHPDEATAAEIRGSFWMAPIGSDCLKKHPKLHFALVTTQSQLQETSRKLKECQEELQEYDRACWHCLNPDSGLPERHTHEVEGKGNIPHWHHYIDPGDGLPSPCNNSDLFEAVLAHKLDSNEQKSSSLRTIAALHEKGERDNQQLQEELSSAREQIRELEMIHADECMERDMSILCLRDALVQMLDSATPNPVEHPNMALAWKAGQKALAACGLKALSTAEAPKDESRG